MTRRPGLRFVVFALLSGGLAVVLAVQIVGLSFEPRIALTATLADATGVRVGDRVRVAGVPVGAVTEVGVDEGRARLRIEVADDLALPTDTRLVVRWLDLTGRRQVDLEPGTADATLADGDHVERTRSAPDLSQLATQLGPLARALDPEQLNELLASVDQVLQGRTDDLVGMTEDVGALLETLASRDQTIDQMITDYGAVASTLAEREQQIRTVVDNLVALTDTFGGTEETIGPALADAADLTDRLATFLDANGEDTGALLADLADVVEVATGRIDDLEQGLADLPDALEALYGVLRHGDYIRVDAVCISVAEPPCPALRSGGSARTGRPVDDPEALRDLLLGRERDR